MVLALYVVVLALAAFSNAAAAKPKPAMGVHEHRAQAPTGFVAVAPAPADTPLKLRLILKERDIDGLIEALYRVSDPAGPDYGQYLSQDEVADFMAPAPDTLAAVNDWLADNNVHAQSASPAGEWLELTLPTSKANALFDADFTVFLHSASGTHGIRTLQYSVPTSLAPKISLLYPGVSFWAPPNEPKVTGYFTPPNVNATHAVGGSGILYKRADPSCPGLITPGCMQQYYGIPSASATQRSNSLSVSGLINQYANHQDLSTFLSILRPDIKDSSFLTVLLNGGQNPQDISAAGIEADLDIQYTVGVASRVPARFISVGTSGDDFLDILNYLYQDSGRSSVLTTSYGVGSEDAISPNEFITLCNYAAALGARGTSVIFASGDTGVGQSCSAFVPTYPSGCPYITSVGATEGAPPESAAGYSTGGFSHLYARPSYQDGVVSSYLSRIGGLYAGRFNSGGRAFPDVALAGTNFAVVSQGKYPIVSGTSASAPVFASIIALINDRLASVGRPPLGFRNPFLYANTWAFTDITKGSNPGCGTNGFPAIGGWDPVTGLGTPYLKRFPLPPAFRKLI